MFCFLLFLLLFLFFSRLLSSLHALYNNCFFIFISHCFVVVCCCLRTCVLCFSFCFFSGEGGGGGACFHLCSTDLILKCTSTLYIRRPKKCTNCSVVGLGREVNYTSTHSKNLQRSYLPCISARIAFTGRKMRN